MTLKDGATDNTKGWQCTVVSLIFLYDTFVRWHCFIVRWYFAKFHCELAPYHPNCEIVLWCSTRYLCTTPCVTCVVLVPGTCEMALHHSNYELVWCSNELGRRPPTHTHSPFH